MKAGGFVRARDSPTPAVAPSGRLQPEGCGRFSDDERHWEGYMICDDTAELILI